MPEGNSTPITPSFDQFPQLMEAIRKGDYTPMTTFIQTPDSKGRMPLPPAKEQPFLYALLDCLWAIPKEPRTDKGFVYLVQCGGRFKIGKSKNVKKRISGLQFPPTAKIVCTIKSEEKSKLETSLHKKFAGKRVEGEWFKLNKADVEYIKGLVAAAQ